ncbi:MAG: 30S ribosomal protein S3ae [Methanomicrobiales archaeon]|nr:30S ribosomal protein S3ae [Methanomicrobiales archaeon]
MVKKKQVGRKVEGWKAKSWYKVYVPEVFGKNYLGDTIANEPEKVVGRVMETTLGEITQDYSKQHVKLRFRIREVAGDAAYTEFAGHELTRDFMRSLVKRRTSRIDVVLPVVTKDGKQLRVTVTAFTLFRANLSQAHNIRSTMSQFVMQAAAQNDMDSLVRAMVSGDIAKELHKLLKVIHPVRRVEVIKSKLEERKKELLNVPMTR